MAEVKAKAGAVCASLGGRDGANPSVSETRNQAGQTLPDLVKMRFLGPDECTLVI